MFSSVAKRTAARLLTSVTKRIAVKLLSSVTKRIAAKLLSSVSKRIAAKLFSNVAKWIVSKLLLSVVSRITAKRLSSVANRITAQLLSNKDINHSCFQIPRFHYRVFSGWEYSQQVSSLVSSLNHSPTQNTFFTKRKYLLSFWFLQTTAKISLRNKQNDDKINLFRM